MHDLRPLHLSDLVRDAHPAAQDGRRHRLPLHSAVHDRHGLLADRNDLLVAQVSGLPGQAPQEPHGDVVAHQDHQVLGLGEPVLQAPERCSAGRVGVQSEDDHLGRTLHEHPSHLSLVLDAHRLVRQHDHPRRRPGAPDHRRAEAHDVADGFVGHHAVGTAQVRAGAQQLPAPQDLPLPAGSARGCRARAHAERGELAGRALAGLVHLRARQAARLAQLGHRHSPWRARRRHRQRGLRQVRAAADGHW
mmetsp:Transcript_60462/g.197891  ORF Transcript_60462/g.197891 Transcript_60462/m.197891 type:complete len:248 (+) Transcript_60462:1417-2160(+)